jgi:hypothetical protein
VKLPGHIIGAGIDFCKSLIAIYNNESNTYGVKSNGPGRTIKVEEDTIQFYGYQKVPIGSLSILLKLPARP